MAGQPDGARVQLRAESSRLTRYAEGLFRVLNSTAWEKG
jgi:hypothetical protein